MTTTTNDISTTLNGSVKTTDSYAPGGILPFEVVAQGTFVGRLQFQVSYNDGTDWITLLTFEAASEVRGVFTKRSGAIYRLSWDDAVTGDSGGYSSGSAKVFLGRSGSLHGGAYGFVKMVGRDGRVRDLAGGTPGSPAGDVQTVQSPSGSYTFTFADGSVTSNSVDIRAGQPQRVWPPSNLHTIGSLTAEGSLDGVTWIAVYQEDNSTQWSYVLNTAKTAPLNPVTFQRINYLRLKAGVAPSGGSVAVTLTY